MFWLELLYMSMIYLRLLVDSFCMRIEEVKHWQKSKRWHTYQTVTWYFFTNKVQTGRKLLECVKLISPLCRHTWQRGCWAQPWVVLPGLYFVFSSEATTIFCFQCENTRLSPARMFFVIFLFVLNTTWFMFLAFHYL